MGKEEIARNEQCLFFPQCFLLNQIIIPHLVIFLTPYLYLLMNWKSLKLAYQVKGLKQVDFQKVNFKSFFFFFLNLRLNPLADDTKI